MHKCKKPCTGEWEAVPPVNGGRQVIRQLDGEYGLVYAVTSIVVKSIPDQWMGVVGGGRLLDLDKR